MSITAYVVVIVLGARCLRGGTGMGAGGAKTDVTVSTTGGREERRGEEDEDESNTGGGYKGTGGGTYRMESSGNPRCSTPSLYILSVIFVRSNGTMPAFSNPAMQLLRVVACSHALRVAAAMCFGKILSPCRDRHRVRDAGRCRLKGPNTEISATCKRWVV